LRTNADSAREMNWSMRRRTYAHSRDASPAGGHIAARRGR
jgi:hypothetical protein